MTVCWEEYRSGILYAATASGQAASVHKLLSEGVNPDWFNPKDGLTPLHIAALEGRAECVLSLLRAGADIYATDAHGCTALDFCTEQRWSTRRRNYKHCSAYLRKAHADCQDRSSSMEEYQGIVVVHPGEELGLVREEVREEVRDAVAWRLSTTAELEHELRVFDLTEGEVSPRSPKHAPVRGWRCSRRVQPE
tara:strand:+ start:282 stop:860 length:579 start_codon:yes stop_codon:yes gene_type:complete